MMNKKEIIFWKTRYNKEEDLYNTGLEEELRKKFRKNNQITKSDLIKIVKWKFQGRSLHRQKRTLNHLKVVSDTSIKEISRRAFEASEDKRRLELKVIKGVGNALSSVILAFYDPQNYGILDIHAWRGLFDEKEPLDISSNPETAIKFFNKLREISSRTGLSCRDIEKAYFKKDLEIPNNR